MPRQLPPHATSEPGKNYTDPVRVEFYDKGEVDSLFDCLIMAVDEHITCSSIGSISHLFEHYKKHIARL